MAIRQRGNAWQADVRVAANQNPTGSEVRVRLAAASKDEAIKLEARARLAICETGFFEPKQQQSEGKAKGTLKDALKLAWNSKAGRRGGWSMQKSGEQSYWRAEQAVKFFGEDRACRSISTKDMDKLIEHFRSIGLRSGSARAYVGCFYKILGYAQKEGWMQSRPMYEKPEAAIARDFILSPELENVIMDTITDAEFADFFKVAVETGLRLNELATACVWQWKFDLGYVIVTNEQSKSGKARHVFLSDTAIAIMKKRCEGLKAPDLIWRKELRNRHNVAAKMRRLKQLIGYSKHRNFVFHSLRHTRATRLAQKSKNPFVVQDQLGHSDIKTSMRYIHMANAALGADDWRNA